MQITTYNILNDSRYKVLTVGQVADALELSKSITYRMVKNEKCPFTVHTIGTTIRVDKESFLKSLEQPITI